MMTKVLVTGGAGFIGSHLVESLLSQGRRVAVVDNLDDFYSPECKRRNLLEASRLGKFPVHEADIRDFDALKGIFERERAEVVVHAAARAGVRPSIEQPKLYEDVNIAGTLNLLMLARAFGVRKFVLISSSSVYGATARVPFSEDHVEMRPISPYAATKLASELFCYTYSHLHDLSIISLRLFTVYGPRQRPDLAIHKFAALLDAGRPIPVFGDGSASRDFTFVEDIVAGILAAIDYETRYDVFNLGSSRPVRVLDLVRLLEEVSGKRAQVEFLPPQPGDVPATWADLTRVRRELGYEPKTPLQQGLEKFWAWYRNSR